MAVLHSDLISGHGNLPWTEVRPPPSQLSVYKRRLPKPTLFFSLVAWLCPGVMVGLQHWAAHLPRKGSFHFILFGALCSNPWMSLIKCIHSENSKWKSPCLGSRPSCGGGWGRGALKDFHVDRNHLASCKIVGYGAPVPPPPPRGFWLSRQRRGWELAFIQAF